MLRPCYLRSLSHSSKYWIIYAPAAFLKSERCISCVLSGVEPLFPVPVNGSQVLYTCDDLIGESVMELGAAVKATALDFLLFFQLMFYQSSKDPISASRLPDLFARISHSLVWLSVSSSLVFRTFTLL